VRVEVLYVAECPSHPAAVKLVKDVRADAHCAIRPRRFSMNKKVIVYSQPG
jgi:hypothetical protein